MNLNGFFRQNNEQNQPFASGVKPMGGFDRIVSIFAAPAKLFENLRLYPKMLAPFVIFIIMGIISGVLTIKYTEITSQAQKPILEEKYGADFAEYMTDNSDLSAIISVAQVDSSTLSMVSAVSGALSFLSTYTISGFISAFIYSMFAKFFKGEPKFINIASMIYHILIIDAVGSTLILIISVIFNTPVNMFSLAAFSGNAGYASPLYDLLSSISVFSLWYYALVILGLKNVCSLPVKKAFITAGIIFIATLIFSGIITPQADAFMVDYNYKIFSGGFNGNI